ncbi:MAG: hypothetical protein ACLFPL_00825 [Candidatus Nanoarchaeia archaeon]
MNIQSSSEFTLQRIEESPPSTLENRIKKRINNTDKQKENSLDYYADLLFKEFHKEETKITKQKKFIQIPFRFFQWIDIFPNNYALFTHSGQTLPYIFSNIGDGFSVLASPVVDGYSRKHIEKFFRESSNPQLYMLLKEQ